MSSNSLLLSASTTFLCLTKLSIADWKTYNDLHISPGCTEEEYLGALGTYETAAGCYEDAVNTYDNVNYVVWRADYDNGCHACDISARDYYEYVQLSDSTSFTDLDASAAKETGWVEKMNQRIVPFCTSDENNGATTTSYPSAEDCLNGVTATMSTTEINYIFYRDTPKNSNKEKMHGCYTCYLDREFRDYNSRKGGTSFTYEEYLPRDSVTAVSSTSDKFIGVYYNPGDTHVNAYNARQYCQTYYHDLAPINDDNENTEAVEAVIAAGLSGGHNIWIGYVDSDYSSTESNFVWIDGDDSTFTKWAANEPNDWTVGEDCTVIYTGYSSGYDWNDYPCSYGTNSFICLREPNDYMSKSKQSDDSVYSSVLDVLYGEQGSESNQYGNLLMIFGIFAGVIIVYGLWRYFKGSNEYKNIDGKTVYSSLKNNYQTVNV